MLIKKPLFIIMIGLTCSWLAGCSSDDNTQARNTANSTTSQQTAQSIDSKQSTGQQSHNQQQPGQQKMEPNQGRVLETLSSGGYTYVKVDQNGNQFWLAGAGASVSEGQIINWGQAALMENFTSKTLNRTFEKIYFVSSIGGTAKPVHSTVNLSQPTVAGAPKDTGRVISHSYAGGYTYMEVDTGAGSIWIAAPKLNVSKGDLVRWSGASKMHNFTSKSLDKTFDEILFAAKAQKVSDGSEPAPASNSGEVVLTKVSGGYSYIQVNTQGGEKWLAVPSTKVSVGDSISWNDASLMNNFTSKTLNQTFKEILFAGSITVLK